MKIRNKPLAWLGLLTFVQFLAFAILMHSPGIDGWVLVGFGFAIALYLFWRSTKPPNA